MGGQKAGQRGLAIIADFPSHEEANRWITSLSYWAFYSVMMTPLVSFQNRVEAANKMVQALKAMPKK